MGWARLIPAISLCGLNKQPGPPQEAWARHLTKAESMMTPEGPGHVKHSRSSRACLTDGRRWRRLRRPHRLAPSCPPPRPRAAASTSAVGRHTPTFAPPRPRLRPRDGGETGGLRGGGLRSVGARSSSRRPQGLEFFFALFFGAVGAKSIGDWGEL